MVLRGIKKEQAKKSPSKSRLPITQDILLKIKAELSRDPKKHDHIMLWAACCIASFGFLRCGEFTVPSQSSWDASIHLSVNDVALNNKVNPTVLQITLKASKTAPFRKGIQIYLARTEKQLCPVAALLPYLVLRGTTPGPLFVLASGAFLTNQKFTEMVRSILERAGVDHTKYAGHSFRIGAATSAAAVGIENAHIKMLGRWESAAYQIYVRIPQEQLARLSKLLAVIPEQ